MRRAIGVVAVVVVLCAAVFFRNYDRLLPGAAAGLAARPECGHDWPEEVKIPLIQDIADIPEFHDCQKFIVKEREKQVYGPLVAIFATEELRNLEKQLPGIVDADDGVIDSSTTTPGSPGLPQIPVNVPRTSRAVPVGVIYSDREYIPLGIKPKLNCLYIYWISTGGRDTTWNARMVPEADAVKCPIQSATGVASYTQLEVKRDTVADPATQRKFAGSDDFPPVARWDWDARREEQYVGIYCGAAWCEIGRPGFSLSPPLTVEPSDARPEQRRVKLIKGWYDRQLLAKFDATGALVPTGIVGVVVPHPDLGQVAATDISNWVRVADVSLTSSSDADQDALDQYKEKFAFKKTSIDKPTELSIRNPGKSDQDEQFWEARINPPGLFSLPKKKRVMYRKLKATYEVPGVVRWRWMTLDEGTWARCPYGCCEISYY